VSLESFVAGVREGLGPQGHWAERFATRYLDPPVIEAELPHESESLEL
jgi:hypothetical protein